MHYLYGILIATGAIIAAEILFNYSLGDVLKDLFLRVFKGAQKVESSAKQAAVDELNHAKALYDAALARVRRAL